METAFVYIVGRGGRYVPWFVESLRTLRENGGWGGPVHVITTVRDKFPEVDGVNFIDVELDQKLDSTLKIKIYKTKILELVDCKNCVYVDSDVLINSSVEPFLESLSEEEYELGFFIDKGEAGKVGRPYHTGILHLVNSERTKILLKQWDTFVRSMGARWDQASFREVVEGGLHGFDFYDPFKFREFDERWLSFPDGSGSDLTEEVIFAHFTSTRRPSLKKYGFGVAEEQFSNLY